MRVFNQLRVVLFCALNLCIFAFFSSSAFGTLIHDYNSKTANHVNYTDIWDQTNGSVTPPTKFNYTVDPSVSGDSLVFLPSSFEANSSYVSGSNTESGHLYMTISSINSSLGISNVTFTENGDYRMIRNTTSSNPLTNVGAMIDSLIVTKINGISVDPVSLSDSVQFSHTFSLSGSDLFNPSPIKWDGTLSVDVNKLLQDKGKTGYATEVQVVLGNSVLAMSDSNSYADITKNQLIVTTNTVAVPEPGILLMLATGLLGAGLWWRKK